MIGLGKQKIVAWNSIKDYIEKCNYTWSFNELQKTYQNYYEKGSYTSYTFRDIINQFPSEMKLLFSSNS